MARNDTTAATMKLSNRAGASAFRVQGTRRRIIVGGYGRARARRPVARSRPPRLQSWLVVGDQIEREGETATNRATGDRSWRRQAAGRTVSSDERFAIEQESAGRWFLLDEAQRDELGLARTSGPFATLAEARSAADERRAEAAPPSPLGRASKSTRANDGRTASRPGGQPTARSGRGQPSRPSRSTSRSKPPPPPSWLDRLASSDPGRATLARSWISALERIGIEDAEALVRRDVEADEPAIAERLIARSVARRAIEPAVAQAIQSLGAVGVPEDVATLLRAVAARAVELTLEAVSRGRGDDAPTSLPSWEVLERVRGTADRGRRVSLRSPNLTAD